MDHLETGVQTIAQMVVAVANGPTRGIIAGCSTNGKENPRILLVHSLP